VIQNILPRSRLDAGTYGTMGVGLGFAIAAAMVHPDRRVVCVEGDSAFGFSGMELETACRYKLPIIFIIINNNGIYGGLDPGAVPARRSKKDVNRVVDRAGVFARCARTSRNCR